MEITKYQRVVLDTYQLGEFAQIKTDKQLRDCGDSMLQFLMSETDEDCESVSEACGRIERAIADLNTVLADLRVLENTELQGDQSNA